MADTTLSARVWPEDTGTGTSDGNEDWDSAGFIGGMAAKDNSSDYVEAGLGITTDYATPAFDLAPGLAYIKYTGGVDIQLPTDDASTYSGTWDQGVTFAIDVDAQVGIALTDAAVNRVYLATDLSTNDGAYVRVDTEASPNVPTDPHIQIGEVDTSADTITELAREPDASFEDVTVSGKMDAASAEVGDLLGGYSDKVRGITSGGAVSTDPASSTTPIQDTIDTVESNGGGAVIVPPTTVSEDTELVLPTYVSLLGHGIEVSKIEVQNPTQSLLTIDDDSDNTPGSLTIDGIAFDGLNANLTEGAIYHPSETSNVNIGQVKVRSFIGKAWYQENAAFQLTCDQFLANNFDAGGESEGVMHFEGGGRAQKYDMLSIYPKDFDSGEDSDILTFDSESGPDVTIDYINVGGTAGRILDQGPYPFTLRGCNYEPVDNNSDPYSLFRLNGQAPAHIQGVRMTQDPSFDYVYSLEGESSVRKKIMGPARVHNATLTNVVSIDADLYGGACQFQGSTDDVDNNYGDTSVPLYCLDGEVSGGA